MPKIVNDLRKIAAGFPARNKAAQDAMLGKRAKATKAAEDFLFRKTVQAAGEAARDGCHRAKYVLSEVYSPNGHCDKDDHRDGARDVDFAKLKRRLREGGFKVSSCDWVHLYSQNDGDMGTMSVSGAEIEVSF
ncbi:MAG: hypothetical protein AAB667_01380 [Patescibacteria group bacterium]